MIEANVLLLAGADPKTLIRAIAEKVLAHLDCDVFFNYVYDDESDRLHLNAYGGVSPEVARGIEWLERGSAICGCVARDGERIVSEDVQHNRDERAALVRSLGVQAYACQPLQMFGRTVGTLSFGSTQRPRFSEDELAFMLAVAAQVSVAMERNETEHAYRARLEQEVRDRTEELVHVKEQLASRATDKCLQLFNSIDEGFCVVEVLFDERGNANDYVLLETNPAFEEQSGLTNAVGKTIRELNPAPEEYWFETYGRVATTGESERFEAEAAGLGRYYDVYAFRIGRPEEHQVAILFNDITERRRRELDQSFLLELSDALRPMRDPLEVQATAGRLLGERLDVDRVWYADIREAEGVANIRADYFRPGLESISGQYTHAELMDVREALRSGTPLTVSDVEATHSLTDSSKGTLLERGIRSFVSVPLVKGHDLVWILTVASGQIRAWKREEVALICELGSRTWEAVERARLFIAEQQRAETQRLMLDAAQTLTASMDLREVLTRLADVALGLTSVSRVFVNLIDMDAEVLTPVVPSEALAAPSPGPIPFDRLSETSRRAIATGRTAILDYELPETAEYDRSIAQANNSRVVLFVPLVFEGEVLGHIALDEPGERHSFTAREIDLIEGVASEAAIAVKNAQLFEAQRNVAGYAEALNSIGDSIHSSLEIDEIMKRVVEEAAGAISVDAVAIAVHEEGDWPIRHQYGLPESVMGAPLTEGAVVARRAAAAGKAVVVPDVRIDPGLRAVLDAGIGALIAVPLLMRGDTFGVLMLLVREERRHFTDLDVDFAVRLAGSVSLALSNSRLYETEHHIAETLQETLVVLPSNVPGVRFSRAYESATFESGRVGGDFVDAFEGPGHLVGISLGDVSGKGIDAAVTTSLVRTTLRVHALDGLPPAEIAAKANRVMRRFSSTESFVTLWFGLLNTKTGLLRYVCAGHPPGFVMGPDGGIQELECRDPILGAFDDATYFESQTVLTTGDRLILYSDGVTEARSPDGRFLGSSGLLGLLARNQGERTERLSKALMDDVVEFSAGVLRDDAAVLVVQPVRLRARSESASNAGNGDD